jgi:hypothetical protein
VKFFVIRNKRFDDSQFAYGEEFSKANTGDAVHCPECDCALTMLEWLPPFEIRVSKKKVGDVIFGSHSHFIVSANFKELYQKQELTGIDSFEKVNIYNRGKQLDLEYYFPRIFLSLAHIDLQHSGIEFKGTKTCNTCQRGGRLFEDMRGLVWQNPHQIQKDIFCSVILPGDIVVSANGKSVLSQLSNLEFIEADKYRSSWILT